MATTNWLFEDHWGKHSDMYETWSSSWKLGLAEQFYRRLNLVDKESLPQQKQVLCPQALLVPDRPCESIGMDLIIWTIVHSSSTLCSYCQWTDPILSTFFELRPLLVHKDHPSYASFAFLHTCFWGRPNIWSIFPRCRGFLPTWKLQVSTKYYPQSKEYTKRLNWCLKSVSSPLSVLYFVIHLNFEEYANDIATTVPAEVCWSWAAGLHVTAGRMLVIVSKQFLLFWVI